jgi:hypothetical protein
MPISVFSELLIFGVFGPKQNRRNCSWSKTSQCRCYRRDNCGIIVLRGNCARTQLILKRTNAEGHNMAKQDASKENGSSLEQAQYEYRKTIYFAGLKILETFSEAVIGRDPSDGGESVSIESASGTEAAGPRPGGPIYAPPPGPRPGGPIYGPTPGPAGPPPGWHIYTIALPPCGCAPHADGPPPGTHIYAVTKLVEVVLSLKPAPKQRSQSA